MQPDDGPGPTGTKEKDKTATAEYIAEMCRDLARMARGGRLDTLAYLLDMAGLEAESVGRGSKIGH
jgi:hypothetical protein